MKQLVELGSGQKGEMRLNLAILPIENYCAGVVRRTIDRCVTDG